MENLHGVTTQLAGGATATGETSVNYDYDLGDACEEADIYINFGTIATIVGTPVVNIKHDSDSGYATVANITGLSAIPIVVGQANKHLKIGVVRPTKRYLRVNIDRTGTGNGIVLVSVIVIRRHKGIIPGIAPSTEYSRVVKLGV